MLVLIAGLVIFLGMHSVKIVAPGFRQSRIDQWGDEKYKRIYTLISVVGFLLIIIGYGRSRYVASLLWHPHAYMHYATAILSLIAFMLMASSSIPDNKVKIWVKHPMSLAVAVWSFSHLLANARLGDIFLFGSFFVWSLTAYLVACKRDVAVQTQSVAEVGNVNRVIIGGAVVWVVFGLFLHRYVIGIHPFGWF